MPKRGGGKSKGKSKGKRGGGMEGKRECPFATEDQVYGKVTKLLGSCRMILKCVDGVERVGHVRGSMQKKIWIGQGDVVLLSLRAFQDGKGDIVHKYHPEEVYGLREAGELPVGMLSDKPSRDTDELSLEDEAAFVFSNDLGDFDSKGGELDIDAI